MLTSDRKHMWSRDAVSWIAPKYSVGQGLGGSEQGWPPTHDSSDQRMFLPFWGSLAGDKAGGCCHTDKTRGSYGWRKSMQVSYCSVTGSKGAKAAPKKESGRRRA